MSAAQPTILFEDEGSKGLLVRILVIGKVRLEAVINIRQPFKKHGKNDIHVYCQFYLNNAEVKDISKLEEVSEFPTLISFYQSSIEDKQKLLLDLVDTKKARKYSSDIITRLASPFKYLLTPYNYVKELLFRINSNKEMINIYTVDGEPEREYAGRIVARTVIEVDAEVLTILNSQYLNTWLTRHLFFLHLCNVSIAGQLVVIPAYKVLSEIAKSMQKFLKRGFWYVGLAGFGIHESISLAYFAMLNEGGLPSFPEELQLYIWPILTPSIVIILRLITPRIISLVIRRAIKNLLGGKNQ